MARYVAWIHVMPKPGVADPPGEATARALHALGFDEVSDVRIGRRIRVELVAQDPHEALRRAQAMAEQLLANPVLESFEVEVVEAAPAAAGPV